MKKRIIFMGTPGFAAHILSELLQVKQDMWEIVAVVSQPDKAVGRKRVIHPTPVKEVAVEHNLHILQPEKITEAYDELVELQPDLIITAAYGQLVPDKILAIPQYKCINVHGSLLPKHRGGAPIHRSIMNGDTETGITIMYMVKRLDAGDMLYQRSMPILEEDNLETMYEKLQVLGAEMLLTFLPKLFNGEVVATPQDETKVTFSPNIKREETKINWQTKSTDIFNQVRGLYPMPATYATIDGGDVKIFKVGKVDEQTDALPGTIVAVGKNYCHVATIDGIINVLDVQISGKKRMSIQDSLNGAGRAIFKVGARFE